MSPITKKDRARSARGRPPLNISEAASQNARTAREARGNGRRCGGIPSRTNRTARERGKRPRRAAVAICAAARDRTRCRWRRSGCSGGRDRRGGRAQRAAAPSTAAIHRGEGSGADSRRRDGLQTAPPPIASWSVRPGDPTHSIRTKANGRRPTQKATIPRVVSSSACKLRHSRRPHAPLATTIHAAARTSVSGLPIRALMSIDPRPKLARPRPTRRELAHQELAHQELVRQDLAHRESALSALAARRRWSIPSASSRGCAPKVMRCRQATRAPTPWSSTLAGS